MQPAKTTAKDFFLHLGMLISLYAGVGFVLNLLFSIINTAYPAVTDYYYSYSNISFPVSALIILTPVFLILSSLIAKEEAIDGTKKEIWIKRWSVFFTLFLTGAITVGDLIAVLYVFLDGQDLTTAFLLKVLAVFVVSGAVFGYFYQNLRGALDAQKRLMWRIIAVILVVVPIILGFVVIGSPKTQRYSRIDERKVQDLQSIQNEIIAYFQNKGTVPVELADLEKSSLYFAVPNDAETGAPYSYTMIAKNSFSLCADFHLNSKSARTSYLVYGGIDSNWDHQPGNVCFTRTIDPERYPRTPMPTDKGM